MGLDDLVNKVKEWAGKNPDKADQAVDKGTSAAKGRFAGHDQQFDTASEKAKDYLHGSGEQKPPPAAPPPESAQQPQPESPPQPPQPPPA